MLFNTAETYEAAQEVCAMLPKGAHLATISDQRENSVVQQLAAHAAPSVYGWSDAYIGLDDLTTAGTYAWKTGEPVAYTRWSPGEPNHGAQAGNEHCAVIKGSTVEGAWDDRPCTLAYPFICER